MTRLGVGVGVAAAALPWTALLWGGTRKANLIFDIGPAYLYTAFGLLLVGLGIASRDTWLGAFVAYLAARAVVVPSETALTITHWIALGAVGLLVVRAAPSWLRYGLIVSALAQTVVAFGQWLGADWLWGYGLQFPHGTFGNPKHLGMFLALVAPLAPLWAAGVLLGGIVLSHSWLAALAALTGLGLRYGVSWRLFGLGAATLAGVTWLRGTTFETLWSRLEAWDLARQQMTAWTTVFGHGLGSWAATIPPRQTTELFLRAHSDVVQLGYEAGLVALVLLALWIRAHRPWRAAPLGILVLAFYPFHVAPIAAAAIVVLGLVTTAINTNQVEPHLSGQ